MSVFARKRRIPRQEISPADAALLREVGLNPDDLRDALSGRKNSLLFRPFRDLR